MANRLTSNTVAEAPAAKRRASKDAPTRIQRAEAEPFAIPPPPFDGPSFDLPLPRWRWRDS